MDAQGLPGKPTSIWLGTTPTTSYPPLPGNVDVDVAIIGGGIVGVSTASFLAGKGLKVALLERGRILSGVTGFTTAKVTSLHNLIYKDLIDKFGTEKARLYGEANEWAIRHIRDSATSKGIDCDLVDEPSYTYAMSDDTLRSVEEEVSAAQSLGLPASFEKPVTLPFECRGAVRFDRQLRFHPRKYLLRIAEEAAAAGVSIFESTIVTDVEESGGRCTVKTDLGNVTCRFVVVASHFPIYDPAMYFARLYPTRSYAMAVKVGGALPEGMFVSAEEPERSIRRQLYEDGEILIIGGENHKAGQDHDTRERYRALVDWSRENFQVEEVLYRWSTQDNGTPDTLPYVGKIKKGWDHIFIATGFGGWGIANGTMSGKLISDQILGHQNPWTDVFDPNRSEIKAAGKMATENLDVAKHLIGDKLRGPDHLNVDEIAPGEAKIIDSLEGKAGVFRDEQGVVHAVMPKCTHMGCDLHWNTAEQSWDCPCHGSRFDADGVVLHTPAVTNLKKIELF